MPLGLDGHGMQDQFKGFADKGIIDLLDAGCHEQNKHQNALDLSPFVLGQESHEIKDGPQSIVRSQRWDKLPAIAIGHGLTRGRGWQQGGKTRLQAQNIILAQGAIARERQWQKGSIGSKQSQTFGPIQAQSLRGLSNVVIAPTQKGQGIRL